MNLHSRSIAGRRLRRAGLVPLCACLALGVGLGHTLGAQAATGKSSQQQDGGGANAATPAGNAGAGDKTACGQPQTQGKDHAPTPDKCKHAAPAVRPEVELVNLTYVSSSVTPTGDSSTAGQPATPPGGQPAAKGNTPASSGKQKSGSTPAANGATGATDDVSGNGGAGSGDTQAPGGTPGTSSQTPKDRLVDGLNAVFGSQGADTGKAAPADGHVGMIAIGGCLCSPGTVSPAGFQGKMSCLCPSATSTPEKRRGSRAQGPFPGGPDGQCSCWPPGGAGAAYRGPLLCSCPPAAPNPAATSPGEPQTPNPETTRPAADPPDGGQTAPDKPAGDVVTRLNNHALLVHAAQPADRGDILHVLDGIDVPWPQVQLNMWAVQISGTPDEIGWEARRITKMIGDTRDRLISMKRYLAGKVSLARPNARQALEAEALRGLEETSPELAARVQALELDGSCSQQLNTRLGSLEFITSEPLSLNEALILLALREDREQKLKDLREWFTVQRQAACGRQEFAAGQCKSQPADAPQEQLPFRRLEEALGTVTPAAYCESFRAFLRAIDKAQARRCDLATAPGDESAFVADRNAARSMLRNSVQVDRVLRLLLDAFTDDVEELYFAPLLDEIRLDIGKRGACRPQWAAAARRGDGDGSASSLPACAHGGGVALAGRTHLVVTSSRETDLDAEMASSVQTSTPAPFGKDLLDLAFANDTKTGTGRILAAIPQGQAALLAAGLLSESPPRYSKVSPGVSVHVVPTVVPDGSAARLQIDARFGVVTSDYDPSQQSDSDTWAQPPPAGISSHHVITDAEVGAFDLFDISSFAFDSSVPQAPFVFPILGRLPIVGQIFQFRRQNVTTRHESLVLVNSAILPRSLSLAEFYRQRQDCPPPAA